MKKFSCEEASTVLMAEADGEAVEYAREAAIHVDQCDSCRHELSQMLGVDARMMLMTRAGQEADLWLSIQPRVIKKQIGWLPFIALFAGLIAYKVVDFALDTDPGYAFKLIPVAAVVILFILIRENPFRINAELSLER